MSRWTRRGIHVLLAATTAGLAVLLMLSALRTYRALDEQREVYLRSRAGSLAARLESTPSENWQQSLADEEPFLAGLAVFERESSPPSIAGLWEGRELFLTEHSGGLFRAYVPFHADGRLRVARIDIDERAADFLTSHAKHHLVLAGFGGLSIIVLTMLSCSTAQRLARAERKQSELQHLARLGEMSASLAHEIRNPLGTIKGFAQLLQESLRGEHAAYLSPILRESTRLEALVRDLLLYGRAAQPRLQQVESAQCEELLRQHAAYVIGDSAVRLETEVATVTFSTDLNLLEQVLLNLLRNAVDAVREQPGGLVRFTLLAEAGSILLRVVDNGPGLSAEAAKKLYEPFFTTKASGTGLGLSISKKLTEALGGTLRVAPRPEGGVVAEIRLPHHSHV